MAQPQNGPEAMLRFAGMFGSAWRDGFMLGEVVDVTSPVQINRVEVPIVGSTRNGAKPGRETREGSMRIQKLDAKWEYEIWSYMSQGLEARRALRDDPSQTRPSRTFDLHLKQDDPDALGLEEWVLHDVQIWSLPLGIAIADDITEREFNITWENEEPVYAFQAARVNQAFVPQWLTTAGAYRSNGTPPLRDF